MAVTLEAFGLDKLSADDKQELIGLLEQSLAPDDDFVMTPDELAELDRRVAFARANPGLGTPWEEVYEAALARSRRAQEQQ